MQHDERTTPTDANRDFDRDDTTFDREGGDMQRRDGEFGGEVDGPTTTDLGDEEQAADLPDREAMSLVNANLAIPVNAAIAANVLSDNSTALAGAVQDTPIDQST